MTQNQIKVIVKLVEDNFADVAAVKDILDKNPLYDLECFMEARPFLESLTKEIDLVITDLRMLDYDPMATIKELHRLYPGIRIIVISAAFTEETYSNLFWFGVNGVIKKNGAYWPDDLMRWIDHLTPDILARKKLIAL